MRRRRLAFPTGKVARPLAVTDESQNAAYFLQPNWNGSIVHLTAHKQSRFQLTRLAARATLPAREGKCALRAQDAHLYKSQFAKASLVEGPRGCYGRNQVRNALSGGTAAQIPICRSVTGRGAQWRQYVMPTFVTNCLQAQPGRGAQRQLYLVPNARNALAAGFARKIQKEFIFLPLDIFSTL